MILEIQHETRLRYSRPVTEWISEFRVEPVSDVNQSCASFHLDTSHPAPLNRYLDGFGNRVHHFNLISPQQEVWVLAAGIVETHPIELDPLTCGTRISESRADRPIECLDYLRYGGPVRLSERLVGLSQELNPQPDDATAEYVLRVGRLIHERFEYAKAVTNAMSPIDDVLELGKGVCQDFAHLMLGLLRHAGIPARYVSGYIHRPGKESQSHAWVEAWVTGLGWLGYDPTNDSLIQEQFVKVAVGRDFSDVQPNRGVYRGTGEEHMFARVHTRELDRVPTLSWREQLPKLDAPLVEILPQFSKPQEDEVELAMASQQQQ